jgi:hypothetical protein
MAIKNSWLRNRNKPSSNVDEDIWAVRSLSVKSAAKSTGVEETEKQTPARVAFVVDAREEEENPSELNSDPEDERNTEDLVDEISQAEHEVVKVQEGGITFVQLNSELDDKRNAEEDLDEIPLAEHEVVEVEERDILRFFLNEEEQKEVEKEETDDDDDDAEDDWVDEEYINRVCECSRRDIGDTVMAGSTALFIAATNAVVAGSIAATNAVVAGSIAAAQGYTAANEAVENMIFRSDDDESIEGAPFEPVVFGPAADYVSQVYDDAGMALAKAIGN